MFHTGLLKNSVMFLVVEALNDLDKSKGVLQSALIQRRAREFACATSKGPSSRSPQSKNKKPKKKRTSSTGLKRGEWKDHQLDRSQWSLILKKGIMMNMPLLKEEKGLHQLNQVLTQETSKSIAWRSSGTLGEMGLVENANSHFLIPNGVFVQRSLTPNLPPSPTTERATTTTPSTPTVLLHLHQLLLLHLRQLLLLHCPRPNK